MLTSPLFLESNLKDLKFVNYSSITKTSTKTTKKNWKRENGGSFVIMVQAGEKPECPCIRTNITGKRTTIGNSTWRICKFECVFYWQIQSQEQYSLHANPLTMAKTSLNIENQSMFLKQIWQKEHFFITPSAISNCFRVGSKSWFRLRAEWKYWKCTSCKTENLIHMYFHLICWRLKLNWDQRMFNLK